MQRNLPLLKKFALLRGWPARLDQELRSQFGDELAPRTSFDTERKAYNTEYVGGEGSPQRWPEVDQYIAGFYAAITMVLE